MKSISQVRYAAIFSSVAKSTDRYYTFHVFSYAKRVV